MIEDRVLITTKQAPSYRLLSPRRMLQFTSHSKTPTSHTSTSTYLVSLESSSECSATICPVSAASGRWSSQVLPWEPVCSSSSPSTARPVTLVSMLWSTSSRACSTLFYTVSHEKSFHNSLHVLTSSGFTPEAFDAPIRGTACGLSSSIGRMAGIISPLIAQQLLPSSAHAPASAYDNVLYLAGAVTFGCVIFTALLPSKMVGSQSM